MATEQKMIELKVAGMYLSETARKLAGDLGLDSNNLTEAKGFLEGIDGA